MASWVSQSSLEVVGDRGTVARKDLEAEYVRRVGRGTNASRMVSFFASPARCRPVRGGASDFEGDGETMGQDAVFCTTEVRDRGVDGRIGLASAETPRSIEAAASRLGKVAERLSIFVLRGVEDVESELRDGDGELRMV